MYSTVLSIEYLSCVRVPTCAMGIPYTYKNLHSTPQFDDVAERDLAFYTGFSIDEGVRTYDHVSISSKSRRKLG